MERPKVTNTPKQREITGEILYYDHARRLGEAPKNYDELSDMAMQMYETEAAMCIDRGVRPEILDVYERYDSRLSETGASCIALADELLTLKDVPNFSFVDVNVEQSPSVVLEKLRSTRIGTLLASDDEQLAIESNGEYYPVLDVKKKDARLTGVGVRIWGWDDEKYVFTQGEDEHYDYHKHLLRYPSDEKSHRREIELAFGYSHPEAGHMTESITLTLSTSGSADVSSKVWISAYAETGYEGHAFQSLRDCSEDEIAAYGDLVAEIVGEEPESIGMRQKRELQEMKSAAATDEAREVIDELVSCTWPAQANYILRRRIGKHSQSIADLLTTEDGVSGAVTLLRSQIAQWKKAD